MRALATFARSIDRVNEIIGTGIAWLALLMVLVQFIIVVMRYVFGVGSVFLQESIVYMHAVLFMVAAGYTLLHNGHVRCDIFYAAASSRQKALIDLIGVIIFLLPVCVLIVWVSWPFVAGSWAVLEGSQEGRSGIPAVFLLKTTILVFALLVAMQGLSMALRAAFVLAGMSMDMPAAQANEEDVAL